MNIKDFVRPEILNLPTINAPDISDGMIRLNANEAPQYPSIDDSIDLNRYPPIRPTTLTQKMAEFYSVTKNEILCSDAERAFLDKLLSLGLYDIFYDHDFPPKTFTWWDYRGGAFQRNIGYRIDLLLGSNSIKDRCSGYFIDKKTRHKSWCVAEPRTSDHVPVRILLD